MGRTRELQMLHGLLERALTGPAALVIDGEAGIGKTTLCRQCVFAAEERGFAVLKTTGASAEISLSFASLSDLLRGIDDAVLSALSPVHQRALVALLAGLDVPGSDERLVATAFRAALDLQSRRRPVAIVVDDAQWLDEPSRLVLGFVVRRLAGRVAVLIAFRSGAEEAPDTDWMQLADPQGLSRMALGPMSRKDLRSIIGARLGRNPSETTMARIYSASGGNPFYGLELARSLDDHAGDDVLPPTLAAIVRARTGDLDDATTEALLTVASAFEPTVDVVAAALGCTPKQLVGRLEPLEGRGVLAFDGSRIRFTHPLIASGVIGDVDPASRRLAHRRLADIVHHAEQRARHMALSAPHGDYETISALDAAADAAAARGAHSAAAELVALAIHRGGDIEFRRLRGAELYFRAGALDEAEGLLSPVLDDLSPGFMRTVGLMLVAAIRGYRDGLASTVGLLERAVEEAGADLLLRTQALLLLSTAKGIAGDLATSVRHARQARADAESTGLPHLRSQALAVWVSASIIHGLGFDAEAMREALEIGDPDVDAPVMFRPTTVNAQTCAWTGRLEEARELMAEVSRRCAERGNELDVVWAAEQLTMIEVASGRYAEAERTAAEALDKAQQLGGRLPLINAYTAVAHAAAYQGRLEDARMAAGHAVAGATAGEMLYLTRPPLMSLAFAQVSDGRYEDALQTLKPLLAPFDGEHDTEIMVGAFLPDAVEALVALDRVDEAEPLVAALENNGARLNRPWMLAVGARSRAIVWAARGDLDAALQSVKDAMAHHEGLPMPFERARTQLLLGHLERRKRHTQAAITALTQAAAVFDEIGSPLWSGRAHRELERLTTRSAGGALTQSERRVAEHAAKGMTNRQIAAAMYVSEKTVEMHLSNAYRKLGVRSRTQLVDRMRTVPSID